jgi:RNA polymerase sigma-70 factor (ECF subfamily)
MILRKVKGLPQREIAQLLGISESTVEAQVVKGTQKIIQYFASQGLP